MKSTLFQNHLPFALILLALFVALSACSKEAYLPNLPPSVYIPNIFSPNGDGNNDYFTIYGSGEVESVEELRIFDRGGELVYQNLGFPPNEPAEGWNGNFRGGSEPMKAQVYAYWVLVRYSNGTTYFFEGDLTLVR